TAVEMTTNPNSGKKAFLMHDGSIVDSFQVKLVEGIKEGDRVILDAGFANSSEVTIVSFTPKKMFAKVRSDEGEEWETMTNRLTAKKIS
ncbi:MAG: hypothetical protein AABY15_06375, partial [Nanoarchaeota archaeon]